MQVFVPGWTVGMIVLLAGCSSGPSKLTSADNGKSIDVSKGDQIMIDIGR